MHTVNPLLTLCILEIPKNSEDPDEMQHDAAFYEGLHCFQLD